jgi:low affinity Fe/Cu permease
MSEQPASWSFSAVARQAACLLGTPFSFAAACAVVILWAVTGPVFGYSDTWQLVINTGTTIVTFLMVFLVQNTATRARCTSSWTKYCVAWTPPEISS